MNNIWSFGYSNCFTNNIVKCMDKDSTIDPTWTGIFTEKYNYLGRVQFGHPHGEGIMEWKDSSGKVLWIYEGEFDNGNKHGQGKLVKSDGDVFEGSFSNEGNFFEGEIRSGDLDKGFYKGVLCNEKPEGKGILTCSNGDVFEGYFKEGMIRGTLTKSNGIVYVGRFFEGEIEGEGKIIYPNGDIFEGYFPKNRSVGPVTDVDKSFFRGELSHKEPEGTGKLTFLNGDVLEGDFRQGFLIKGKMTRKNGDVWNVHEEFRDGKKHVIGSFKFPCGSTYEGNFFNGKIENGMLTVFSNNISQIKSLSEKLGLTEVSLDIRGCTDDTLKELNSLSLPKISSLEISAFFVTSKGLLSIQEILKTLTSMNLSGCSEITNEGFIEVAPHLKNLKLLNLTRCEVGTEGIIELLKNASHLESLILTDCKNLYWRDVTDLSKNNLKLNHLDLSWSRHCSKDLKVIGKIFPNLESLNLSHSKGDFIEGIEEAVRDLKKLKSLDLNLCFVTDQTVAKIVENLEDLNTLKIGASKTTEEGVTLIGRLKKLSHLDLSQCHNIPVEVLRKTCDVLEQLRFLDVTNWPGRYISDIRQFQNDLTEVDSMFSSLKKHLKNLKIEAS